MNTGAVLTLVGLLGFGWLYLVHRLLGDTEPQLRPDPPGPAEPSALVLVAPRVLVRAQDLTVVPAEPMAVAQQALRDRIRDRAGS